MKKKLSSHEKAIHHLKEAASHHAKAKKVMKSLCDAKKMLKHEKKEKKLIGQLSKMHRKY